MKSLFKHILVPLDGSGLAESALPAAAYLSSKLDARVTLFHVIEKDAPGEIHGQRHLRDAGEAERYLREVSTRTFPPGTRVDLHVHTAEAENVASSITEHAGELGPDLIVMCSHGRGGALHLLFGSIAHKVISKGYIPVLVTRPGAAAEALPEFSCNTLLLPIDEDPEHAQAIPVAAELAKACVGGLHLAMVVPDYESLSGESAVMSRFLPGTMTEILEMSVHDAEAYLQTEVKKLEGRDIKVIAHVLRGDPAVVIDEFARKLRAGLIIMATHGKSAMDAFWDSSVPHKVSSLSKVPLLLVPVKKK